MCESPSADLFNVERLKGQGVIGATTGGRGASCIIRFPDRTWVLRHYRRGGLVSKVLNDQYFGLNREKCRSWSEWQLLHQLFREGFPVPRPVAASYWPGCGYYRAALITEYLPETRTLAETLSQGPLPDAVWAEIGRCVARFHQRGVYHADLNAHNIMLDRQQDIYILDFDKGEIRAPGRWQDTNLKRLLRSLNKLADENPKLNIRPNDWDALLTGYENG